ncbi:MAG: diguanylate cyclase [Candidatus Coatesbacteria bacterium]|nr:diguanylate cyclase [Candidatus Coatesbacteria bacterium]
MDNKRGGHMLIVGLWIAAAYWMLESLLDAFVFGKGPLSVHLFPLNPDELWMRSLAVLLITFFSAYVQRIHSEREDAENALCESKSKYEDLVENANSVILRMSSTGEVRYMNRFGLEFFGFSSKELFGRNVVGTIVPETDTAGRDLIAMIEDIGMNPDRYINNENENTCKDGSRVWISWTNKPIFDGQGKVIDVLCIGNDITQRKQMEDKLELALKEVQEMSLIDQLTGLKNRRGFMTLGEQQLKVADRTREGIRLVFIDLDGLKWINDNLGHKVGDQALIEAADVLRETFRDSDIIARLGGDEYAVLAIDVSPAAPFPSARIPDTLTEHNSRTGRQYELQMSVGVATYRSESKCSIGELLSMADELMYEEKRRRKAARASAKRKSPETSEERI